jgi:hypothetical protein
VEVTRGWRKLYNEELRHSFCSPNVIGMIKPKEPMWWEGRAAVMGEMACTYRLLMLEPEEEEIAPKTYSQRNAVFKISLKE